jgi:hypothetical protein
MGRRSVGVMAYGSPNTPVIQHANTPMGRVLHYFSDGTQRRET